MPPVGEVMLTVGEDAGVGAGAGVGEGTGAGGGFDLHAERPIVKTAMRMARNGLP